MHHGKHFRRLNRTMSHRKSMLRNLVTQLIQHDRIKTTLPKAQELKAIADQVHTMPFFLLECVGGGGGYFVLSARF